VACYDAAGAVDDDGIKKAEFFDAGSDLADLLFGVRAGVSSVRNEAVSLDGFIYRKLRFHSDPRPV